MPTKSAPGCWALWAKLFKQLRIPVMMASQSCAMNTRSRRSIIGRKRPIAAIDEDAKLYYQGCVVFDGFQSDNTHTIGTRRNADPAR